MNRAKAALGALRLATARSPIIAILGLSIAFPGIARAYLNTTTGVLVLDGAVGRVCSLGLNASGATTFFANLDQGASNTLVGTIVETCNDPNGYTVTLTTANNASFKGAAAGKLVPYTLTYNGAPVSFSGGTATITPSGSRTTGTGVSKGLNLSISPGTYMPDNYSDTLTITMIGQ